MSLLTGHVYTWLVSRPLTRLTLQDNTQNIKNVGCHPSLLGSTHLVLNSFMHKRRKKFRLQGWHLWHVTTFPNTKKTWQRKSSTFFLLFLHIIMWKNWFIVYFLYFVKNTYELQNWLINILTNLSVVITIFNYSGTSNICLPRSMHIWFHSHTIHS
jgi:hypothetical protein